MPKTLTDQQVIDIIAALLDHEGFRPADAVQNLRTRRGWVASQPALRPLIEHYLTLTDSPRTCQIEHDHWEGRMICGQPLPCPRHGPR